MMVLILGALIGFVIFCNLYVAHAMTAEEMREELIDDKVKFAQICANAFYALAWALKGIKKFVK